MPMTYSDLIAGKTNSQSIQAWVNNTTIPSTVILEDAEAYIYRSLRAVEMRQPGAVAAIPAYAETFPLPARTIQIEPPIFIYGLTTGDYGMKGRIVQVDPAELQANSHYGTDGAIESGLPNRYALIGTATAQLNRGWDGTYALRFHYWQRPSALGTDNETNFVTSRFPRMLRSACLAFANEWMKDAGEKDRWLAVCDAEIARANIEAEAILRRDLQATVTTR